MLERHSAHMLGSGWVGTRSGFDALRVPVERRHHVNRTITTLTVRSGPVLLVSCLSTSSSPRSLFLFLDMLFHAPYTVHCLESSEPRCTVTLQAGLSYRPKRRQIYTLNLWLLQLSPPGWHHVWSLCGGIVESAPPRAG